MPATSRPIAQTQMKPFLNASPRISSLLKKPASGGMPGDRHRADQHRPVGDRDLLRQAAHPAHVLLVVDGVDHRSRIEEQQALEEAVRHEVEDGRRPGPHPERGEHVAQLRQGGVGEHALDVGLGERDRGRQDRGEDADRGHDDHRLRGVGEDRVGAGHEVDAGVDHGRGMDEGRHRRRALHRVGQPDVERELGALADRAGEDEQGDDGDRDRERHERRAREDAIASRMFRVPVSTKIAMIPSAKPTSPTRLTMNAFLAASAADRLRYQNPISR